MRRKSVLDLLDQYSGYQDNSEKHYYENMLHTLIMPMKKNSTEIDYDQHNLWIIDDRLSFFSCFYSDNLIGNYSDTNSKDRTDITLFYENCYLWTEENKNTVVLIEFKRPGRNDYKRGEKDDPFYQIVKYIKTIKAGNLKLPSGKIMPAALKDATFHAYIIADITPTLKDDIFYGIGLTETPDKEGLYGYISNPSAFIEIISYNKLLSDAKKRNSIFFNKIGLTNTDPRQ